MNVTVLGAGNMGRAIATRALIGGNAVRLLDNDARKAESLAADLQTTTAGADVRATDTVAGADVVVLAVNYPAGAKIVRNLGDALAGIVVIDICNPVDVSTFDSLATPPGTSAAEEIQAAAVPGVRVVKAFNTTFAGPLGGTGQVAGQPLDVFVAADDADAKRVVADLVTAARLRPIDAGPLRRARELEALQFLQMTLQEPLRLNWSSTIKLLP